LVVAPNLVERPAAGTDEEMGLSLRPACCLTKPKCMDCIRGQHVNNALEKTVRNIYSDLPSPFFPIPNSLYASISGDRTPTRTWPPPSLPYAADVDA
jgi:hypothetical protein